VPTEIQLNQLPKLEGISWIFENQFG